MEIHKGVCATDKIQLPVGIFPPWPLWAAAKVMAETCSGSLECRGHFTGTVDLSGCTTSSALGFFVLCAQALLLEHDQDYSKGCWCCGINVFLCWAKLLLFRRFSCAGTAKLWISVHVPLVPVKCKGQTLRCAVDPYRLTKMPKWLMDSWFSCSKKIVTAKVEVYRQLSHGLNADAAAQLDVACSISDLSMTCRVAQLHISNPCSPKEQWR